MKYLALILAMLCLQANADNAVARNGKDMIRITDGACPASILALTPEGTRGFFRAAYAVLDGKSWLACWALTKDRRVVIVYSDGEHSIVQATSFEIDPGI